ncbi:MAG: MarC family protein [Microcoleaceae cyanobacterium]
MDIFIRSSIFLFVLLNPFLMSIYLIRLIQELQIDVFADVLIRGAAISAIVFVLFAWTGDIIFTQILQVGLESFLIFGGIIFLVIGLQFFFNGDQAIGRLRGDVKNLPVTIALPYMVGPGTISASILLGSRLSLVLSALSIVLTLTSAVMGILILKLVHDLVKQRKEAIVDRYVDIAGRTSALIIGTFAIDLILKGINLYLSKS